jgi:hypothetical protein
VKRTRGDEPIGAVIHICKEISQGNSLCSYIYLKLANHHVFLFIFYLFSSTKSENKRVEQVPPEVGGFGTSGRGVMAGEGVGG